MFRGCIRPEQNGFDEFGFGQVVSLAVVPVLLGQGLFQAFVSLCVFVICAQVVAEGEVPGAFERIVSIDVKVMRKLGERRAEGCIPAETPRSPRCSYLKQL